MLLSLSLALAEPHDQMLTNAAGAPLHWATMPIRYTIDPTNTAGLAEAGVVAAIVEAAATWTSVEGAHAEYRFVGTERDAVGGYDDHNVVFFDDSWEVSPDLLAITSTWSTEDGEILDFDMAVNTADHAWALDGDAEVEDLQNTLTHEFGHALGFGHDPADIAATMFASAHPGELAKRDLTESDEAVAIFAYSVEFPETELDASESPSCSTTSRGPGWALFALVAPLLRRRRSELA